MSIQALAWVFSHSPTTGAERLVLMSLANHANDLGEAYPSRETIGREARVADKTVKRALAALEAAGAITRAINAAPDSRIPPGRRPNLYRVVMDNVAQVSPGGGDKVSPPGGDPLAARGGQSVPAGGDKVSPQTVKEPSTNRGGGPRATRLPQDFVVSPAMRAWAERIQPPVDVDGATEQFCDHHRAKGSTFADWVAAWRTWVRNEARWRARGGGGLGAPVDTGVPVAALDARTVLARRTTAETCPFHGRLQQDEPVPDCDRCRAVAR